MIKAGIMGATGYAGAEVLRICANHPEFDVAVITYDSEAGQRIADIYPRFTAFTTTWCSNRTQPIRCFRATSSSWECPTKLACFTRLVSSRRA